jgi:hypothetical protein
VPLEPLLSAGMLPCSTLPLGPASQRSRPLPPPLPPDALTFGLSLSEVPLSAEPQWMPTPADVVTIRAAKSFLVLNVKVSLL